MDILAKHYFIEKYANDTFFTSDLSTFIALPLPIFFLLAYIIGSIPFGFLLAKIFGYGDIRKIGSGNIGATNVLRTGNKLLALLTLILDGSKGIAAITILFIIPDFFIEPTTELLTYLRNLALLVGLGSILGHCFPIWLKFKGGKGVATALGVFLTTVPYAGIAACLVWLITAKITKISSLSALVALAVSAIITFVFYGTYAAVICVLISALVFYRHKDNIKRIRSGTEPKIGQKKNNAPST